MAGQYEDVTLSNINKGAAEELFQAELERVIENIGDVNTEPDAVRKILVEIAIKPNKDRDLAAVAVSCKSKLAPMRPHGHFMQLVFDGEKIHAQTTNVTQQEFDYNVRSIEEGRK